MFHEPITTLETRLSAADIDKYSDMAMWVIDNIIYAPLTSPASAVFNGIGGPGVVLLQNTNVVE